VAAPHRPDAEYRDSDATGGMALPGHAGVVAEWAASPYFQRR
jgi:hypothetical protein